MLFQFNVVYGCSNERLKVVATHGHTEKDIGDLDSMTSALSCC